MSIIRFEEVDVIFSKDPREALKLLDQGMTRNEILKKTGQIVGVDAPLRFEAHIYASEPKQRWVKVNGKDLQEGQWVTADIQLKEITPQYVLLQTGRQMFSMEALTEWSYRLPVPKPQ